jgi:hypothetical protein
MTTATKTTTTKRYVVRDVRNSQYEGIGRTKRDPWQVIDTTTNRILDEFSTKYLATMTARDWNQRPAALSLAAATQRVETAAPLSFGALTGAAYDEAQTEALRVRDVFIASIRQQLDAIARDSGSVDLVADRLADIAQLVTHAARVNTDLQNNDFDGYSFEVITCQRCARQYQRRHAVCVCRG